MSQPTGNTGSDVDHLRYSRGCKNQSGWLPFFYICSFWRKGNYFEVGVQYVEVQYHSRILPRTSEIRNDEITLPN